MAPWTLLLASTTTSFHHTPLLPPAPLKPHLNYSYKQNPHFQFHASISSLTNGPSLSLRRPIRSSRYQSQNKSSGGISDDEAQGSSIRRAQQVALWAAEAAYILWLFLLPYAPGDPVWAISSSTINYLLGLFLNFFFVLPLLNSVGINVIEAPVLHPMAEGLFNFVIGWTLLFAPLLYTDGQRDRYKGSLDVLWGFQMFLTNTFLIPYMAIRLNDAGMSITPPKQTKLASLMTNNAAVVGLVGGAVCLFSVFWAVYARGDQDFGDFAERWDFLVSYIGSERLAYAFIWDVCLYSIFQPWLIGDNLQNVKRSSERIVRNLRFIPVLGLVAYLVSLDEDAVL